MALTKQLQDKLDRLPAEPGVYLMKDRRGAVIYVGKAVNLRSRVRSYFGRSGGDGRAFVPLLDKILGDIEILRVGSEQEALLLENELIKRYQPRFNVLLRDDKDFLTLRLDTRQRYPRLEVWRRPEPDSARYFGPYASAPAVRQTLGMVNRHFQLRTCSDNELRRRTRPCLQYQIGRCPAPCVREVPEYERSVRDTILFLEGRHTDLIEDIHRRMEAASASLRFEDAAQHRDHLRAIKVVLERQRVVQVGDRKGRNAVGFYREGPSLVVQILEIRGGRLTGGRSFTFEQQEFPTSELLGSLLMQLYAESAAEIPSELLLPIEVEGREALQELLTERGGKRVLVHVPKRGEKRRLVELAIENAVAAYEMKRERTAEDQNLLERLMKRLELSRLPRRIECYDISQIQGHASVASRVAMIDGRPDKSRYRRYRIRLVEGQDDYSMMREVLLRRLARGQRERDLPDLLVVDGGKGQLGVARAVLSDLAIDEVEVVALAKARSTSTCTASRGEESEEEGRPERVFLPSRKDPVVLPPDSAELLLLTRIRDEAHRFAVEFHRKLRSKQAIGSVLESIEGIGPARRRALLREFGSVRRLKEADTGEIARTQGFSAELARRVKAALSRESS